MNHEHTELEKKQIISDMALRLQVENHLDIDPQIHLTGLIAGPGAPENAAHIQARFSTQYPGFDAVIRFDDCDHRAHHFLVPTTKLRYSDLAVSVDAAALAQLVGSTARVFMDSNDAEEPEHRSMVLSTLDSINVAHHGVDWDYELHKDFYDIVAEDTALPARITMITVDVKSLSEIHAVSLHKYENLEIYLPEQTAFVPIAELV